MAIHSWWVHLAPNIVPAPHPVMLGLNTFGIAVHWKVPRSKTPTSHTSLGRQIMIKPLRRKEGGDVNPIFTVQYHHHQSAYRCNRICEKKKMSIHCLDSNASMDVPSKQCYRTNLRQLFPVSKLTAVYIPIRPTVDCAWIVECVA